MKIDLDVADVSSNARGQVLAGVRVAEAVDVPLEVTDRSRMPFDYHSGSVQVVPIEAGAEDAVRFAVRNKQEVLHSVSDFAAFKLLKKRPNILA